MTDFTNPQTKGTRTFFTSVVIPAAGTKELTVDSAYMTKLLPVLRQAYAAVHAVTTGITVDMKYGIDLEGAPIDATTGKKILFADTLDSVPSIILPIPGGGAQTTISEWAISIGDKLRNIKFIFTNTDVTNPVTVDFYANV